MLIPPPDPKPRPFKWAELHDAATIILEKEVSLDPDEFEAWLRARPGAAWIYLVLAEDGAIEAEVMRQVEAHLQQMPEFDMPSTLAELIDEKGRMPFLSRPIREGEGDVIDIARYQRNIMSGLRYANAHPKGA